MQPNQNANENKTISPIFNQFPINTSQIINYYINLSQNLNMNYNPQTQTVPNNENTENSLSTQQNSNIPLNQINYEALNQLFNMGNLIALLQVQATYQQYSLLMKNMNTNENKSKDDANLIGNKTNRGEKDKKNNINNKINKKSIIKKNGCLDAEQPKTQKNLEANNSLNNKLKEVPRPLNENVSLIKQKPEDKTASEVKTEKKKKSSKSGKNKNEKEEKNKINRYKDLLQDSLLENLDKPKKELSVVINNEEFEKAYKKIMKSERKIKIKKKRNKVKSNLKSEKTNKIKRNNFNLNENTQLNYNKYPLTKIIFHGDNYEKTNSAFDFMKYNYNLNEIKRQRNTNDERENKVAYLPDTIYANNNDNMNNLSEIKPIWLRSKFNGNKVELNNYINSIKQKMKEGREYYNEEKCLEKINENPNLCK